MNIYNFFLEVMLLYTYYVYIHPGVKWAYLLGEMFEWWLYALLVYCTTISAAISRDRSEFRSIAADSIYTEFFFGASTNVE